MSELINMHKRIAMGGEQEANHLKKGGVAKKHHYAKGGGVKGPAEISQQKDVNKIGPYTEKESRTLINDSSQKRALPKPTGKIATMKKGGHAKGGVAIVIAPMRKAAGRGR
jgi:hypothetical protein